MLTKDSTVLIPFPDGMPVPASTLVPAAFVQVSPGTTDQGSVIISEKTLVGSSPTVKTQPPNVSSAQEGSIFSSESDGQNNEKNSALHVPEKDLPLSFPDGGFGWAVVFGAFMIQFCCWGFNFSWGVFQQYYVENNVFPGATLSQISWSGGISTASVFLTCPFQTSMVSRFGLRPIIASGILISGSGMILASFAKTVPELYLTQGLLYGFGAGMALFTSVAIPVQWFDKKRGLASGITVAGSGIGGATLASLNRYLISKAGYKWALRTMGISSITIVCSILFCIRTRIPPRTRGGPLLDVAMFKDRGFTIMYLMGMLVTFGYLIPVFLLPNFVVDLGMKPEVGSSLVSAFAGVNAISRILLGFVADRYGPLNVLILSSVFSGLACLILWMNTHGLAMAIIFVVVYGSNAGGFNSLFPVVAADVIGVEKLAAAVGLLYSGNFFGNLLGTPLASAIIAASGGSYTGTMVFAGSAPILGACLLLIIRFRDEKRIFVRM
ncbi:MAG: major facilitator superfamily domain-containing protein [Benniella sp.]|nr:MAG: major facilitator superfamily domain-containing protein [Benniella sp.]